jgi:hypothetical protein
MSKKAQFYILTAVILLAITFGLFTAKKTIQKPDRTFDQLADNYVKEAPIAANSGRFEDFALRFYDFAVLREQNFEMVTIYISDENVSVLSLVKSSIFINEYNLSFKQDVVFPRTDVIVSIGNEQYDINASSIGVKTIFLLQKSDSKNVRIA